MEDFKIHFYIAFGVLIAFAITIGLALLRNLPKFRFASNSKRPGIASTALTSQGVAITLFCAFYLLLEFTAQNSADYPRMPDVPSWMLVLLGLSNSIHLGSKFFDF